MKNKIIAVLGGARSGKSSFAQDLAYKLNRTTVFVATARSEDGEMAERIKRHQADRPQGWQTVEAPLDLAGAIKRSATLADVILVDCLSVYLSNLLLTELGDLGIEDDPKYPSGLEQKLLAELEDVFKVAKEVSSLVIFVSNEVGFGIVPIYRSARLFRDVSGRINQLLATFADRVFWVQAGLAIELKNLATSVSDLILEIEDEG